MSVAAVMLVKDEVDVIEATVRHLLAHVDEVYVQDNASTDGTREAVSELELAHPVVLLDDDEVAFYQGRKLTALAQRALERGHRWVVPCDADELWYAPDGRALRDWLAGVALDAQQIEAQLFNHVPTVLDGDEPNPTVRLGWRQREPQSVGKVACRLSPNLVIAQGSHAAETTGVLTLKVGGLAIRHFPWRSEEQYLRKILNGRAGYAATSLPQDMGVHKRLFATATDDEIRAHYRAWLLSPDPSADDTLVHDPAPVRP